MREIGKSHNPVQWLSGTPAYAGPWTRLLMSVCLLIGAAVPTPSFAALAQGDPMGYVGGVPRVVFRGQDNHVHELWMTGQWHRSDMPTATGASLAAGNPMGYVGGVPRVVFRGQDNHVHELWMTDQWH